MNELVRWFGAGMVVLLAAVVTSAAATETEYEIGAFRFTVPNGWSVIHFGFGGVDGDSGMLVDIVAPGTSVARSGGAYRAPGTLVDFVAPPAGLYAGAISVRFFDAKGLTLEDWVADYVGDPGPPFRIYPGKQNDRIYYRLDRPATPILSRAERKLGGHKAFVIRFDPEIELPGKVIGLTNRSGRVKQVLALHKTEIYVFALYSFENEFSEHEKLFEAMLTGFKWR